jgi:catechol 2,3-dioxygenase-like lactoylglutathione lyase family enzyme
MVAVSSPGLAGRALVQVALPTRDLARAKAFYEGQLGLPLLMETNGMAFFSLANVRLMVGEREAETLGPGVIYIDAPDLPDLAAGLEARGVAFVGPAETLQRTADGDLQLRFFRDPDENMIGLMGVVRSGMRQA